MQGARPPGTPHRTEYDPTSPRAIRSLAESSYCRGEKISDYLLHRFCSQKDPNFAFWQLVDAPCFRKNNKDTANDPKSENFSILAIGSLDRKTFFSRFGSKKHIIRLLEICILDSKYQISINRFGTLGFSERSCLISNCLNIGSEMAEIYTDRGVPHTLANATVSFTLASSPWTN